MPTNTTTYSFQKPVVGADEDAWGGYLNGNWDKVDDLFDGTVPVTGIDINSGTLDGVTIGGTTAGAGTFTTLTANTSITGTLATAAQPNVTSLGTLTGLTVSGSTSLAGASTSADITFGDNDKAIFGAGSDLQIYHDGASGNTYIDEGGAGSLFIRDNDNIAFKRQSDNANMVVARAGAEVELYHNGSVKLATTSTGIDVTGTVTADGLTVNASASGNFGAVISSATSFSSDALRLQRNGVAAQGMNISAGGESVVFDSQNTGTGGLHSIYEFKSTDETTTKNVLKIDGKTNDISFYEDTGTTAKFFWDASAESLGIGSTVPGAKIHIANTGGDADIVLQGSATGQSVINFGDTADLDVGQILYNHTSDYMRFLTNTAERMRIDSSGNVGIGTSSPASKIHIHATDTAGVSTLEVARFSMDQISNYGDGVYSSYFYNTSTEGARIGMDVSISGGALYFSTGGSTERMRIDSSGNVGIGTSSPSESLHVSGKLLLNNGTNSYFDAAGSNGLVITNPDAVRFEIGSERMRITSSGNVGIGTTSPAYPLDVSTNSSTTNDAVVVARLSANTTGTAANNFGAALNFSGEDASGSLRDLATINGIYTNATNRSSALTFKTRENLGALTERMRIDSSGNLLVGTTSTDPRNFSSGTYGIRLFSSQPEFGVATMYINRSTGTDGNVISFRKDAGTVGSISVTSSATAYNTSSDYRLKENVVDLTDATTRLKQLEPKRFNFIADADTTVDGFLAHEVQTVVPEAITGTHNEVDADGNPVYQGIDQSKLVPLLVATIKELEARITALEAN